AADARGTIVTLNSAARRLLGYGPDDPFPALAELFHEKPARDLVATVLAGLEAEPHELERGGRTLLVTGRALPNGGGLLVIRDVTELRRLEAVRRDFVANVSHELKTPLTSIAGYAETLALEATPGTQTERCTRPILSNARRSHRLRDCPGAPAPHLRTLLPRRSRPLARRGRHRTRPRHREAPGGSARRARGSAQHAGARHYHPDVLSRGRSSGLIRRYQSVTCMSPCRMKFRPTASLHDCDNGD